MKISYNWLKEFLPLEYSPEEVAAMLTGSGLEVEAIEPFESIKGGLSGLVIGEVITCEKHPDADRLKLTTVNVGREELYQIVCGGPNVAAGQKVVVALPGTKLFPLEGEPFVIKQSKIRGQASNGMICAEDEIGLGHSHEGVIVLPPDAKVGSSVKDFYKVQSDFIFEIGLTPNRADAASHIGVARDLAAVIRTKILIEKEKDEKIILHIPKSEIKKSNDKLKIAVDVEDTTACPRYSGISITNVNVSESPAWLKDRLKSIGVNPINSIVDITNYVLHECGQPLHAFDVDEIGGKKIVVRHANENEKFVTLDGVERKMHKEDLMICDEKKAMCIAGVYGGLTSGISGNSKNIFIESACFSPASIRKTSKRHMLKTDASFRFERGTDPELTIYALKRAADLICQVAGGEISSVISDNYPSPPKPAVIELGYDRLDRFAGETIDRKIIKAIAESLEMKIKSENNTGITLSVPLFKVDVTRPADVIEEILRVYGYDRIPVPEKLNASVPVKKGFDKELLYEKVSAYLAANGFHETVTNSLTRGEYASLPGWDESTAVKLLNPLSQELSTMRQDLLTTSLETVQYNINRKQQDLRLFEFGKTYFKEQSGYKEHNCLSVLLTGNRNEESWKSKDEEVDFYLLKAFVKNVLAVCGIRDYTETTGEGKSFSSSLSIRKGNDVLVEYGNVQKALLRKFDISRAVIHASFKWDAIVKHAARNPVRYSEVSKFPSVKRDLSMLIPGNITYAELERIAYQTEKKLLKEIRLFDVYEGEKIGEGKKSIAMSFILQDDQQTLTDQQIGKVMDRLMNAFEKETGAVIRKQ